MFFKEIKELQAHNRKVIALAKEVTELEKSILNFSTVPIQSSRLYLGIDFIDLDLYIKECDRIEAKKTVLSLMETINKYKPTTWQQTGDLPGSNYTLTFKTAYIPAKICINLNITDCKLTYTKEMKEVTKVRSSCDDKFFNFYKE